MAAKTNLVEVRRVNTASTISQRDAYKLMLKDYPDVMSIEQMCEILSISTKTGYRILREGKICCLKVGRAYQYFCSDKLIHDTDIGITEFDFQETRQIITLLISQRLSIAFSVTDRGFWRTFPLALTTRNR